jgi:DNA-binding NarL/FixJ family response regulator
MRSFALRHNDAAPGLGAGATHPFLGTEHFRSAAPPHRMRWACGERVGSWGKRNDDESSRRRSHCGDLRQRPLAASALRRYLDPPTARQLRAEGITMVRVAPASGAASPAAPPGSPAVTSPSPDTSRPPRTAAATPPAGRDRPAALGARPRRGRATPPSRPARTPHRSAVGHACRRALRLCPHGDRGDRTGDRRGPHRSARPGRGRVPLGEALRARSSRLGIVVLAAPEARDRLRHGPAEDAAGWAVLSKNLSLTSPALIYALRSVAAGRRVLDPPSGRRASNGARAPLPPQRPSARGARPRRRGLSNTAIARLALSPRSVEAHLRAAYAVLGVGSDPRATPSGCRARVSRARGSERERDG